jgi:cysteine desulfurase/selenocysteine lyase
MAMLSDFKKEFSDAEGIHFNNAGMAPISRTVAERLARTTTENQFYGSRASDEWLVSLKQTRKTLGEFLDADLTSLALTWNCATAISQAALGFPLTARDQIVTIDQEYSSNFYPWQVASERSGAKLTVVKSEADYTISLEKLMAAIVPGVKLVSVSWVQFQTGAILDLKTLGEHCHRVGAFLIVDGIQALGQLPFSFRNLPVDFIAGASHKWICGTTGQGFLAVKPELATLLQPVNIGGGTYNRIGTFSDPDAKMESSARRFETGGIGFFGAFAMESAMQLLLTTGVKTIADEIFRLSQILRRGLLAQGVELVTKLEQPGGITSFKLPLDRELQFLRTCKEQKISLVKRGDFIRVSTHAFNQDEEIEQVLELLK